MIIPSAWRNITLNQFIQLQELKETGNKITDTVNKIAVLTNSTPDKVRGLTPKKIAKISKRLDFVERLPKEKKVKYFYYKFRLYKREKLDYTTSNQVTDILTLNADEKNVGKKILNTLAVLYYRGNNKDYDADRYSKIKDELKDLDFETALNSATFFLTGLRQFLPGVLAQYFQKLTTYQMEALINEVGNIGKIYDLKEYARFINGTTL